MSVPLYKRSLSKKQYFYHFKKLQKEILQLLLNNFNIKNKDQILIIPQWLIEYKRNEILRSLTIISTCLSRAEAHYPVSNEIKQNCIIYQNKAIQQCFLLHDNIQFCSEIFPVKNINVYMQIAYNIQQEVKFLRHWRKDTKKIKIKDSIDK